MDGQCMLLLSRGLYKGLEKPYADTMRLTSFLFGTNDLEQNKPIERDMTKIVIVTHANSCAEEGTILCLC